MKTSRAYVSFASLPPVWPVTATSLTFVMSALLLVILASGCAAPAPPATVPREVSVSKANCQATSYPSEARRLGASGSTEVEFEVNPEGKVTRVAIAKTSGTTPGHQALDALALSTISKCVFPAAPGFLSATGRMAYVWRLDQ